MSKSAIDTEFLSDVWMRINSVISEQKMNKCEIAKKCGFDRKLLSGYTNISLTYFARICEELNISADFFLFGLEKTKEKTYAATYSPDKCYEDLPTQREIVKAVKKMMNYKGKNISVNNLLGISAQKELMTLADDFGLLHREDVVEIIETCRNYAEAQQKIIRVYEEVYLK
ncbi:MAG: hypothetical protein OSJ72_14435 [Lachnospiraceae bacterium]|nr:hypothetical protein [Lachnospiraceae bacterium]